MAVDNTVIEKKKWIVNQKNSEIHIKGCKVKLKFLPESNGKAIATVRKILTSSAREYRDISSKSAAKKVDFGSKL